MKIFFFKFIDATVGAALCWLVGRGRHGLRLDPPVPPDPLAASPRRVLVIRPGGLGDMVQLLPTLRALRARFPSAAVEVVCERRNAAVLRLSGLADRVLCYDAHPLATLLALWRTRYDVAIDAEQFHHLSALMALCGGAPVRIGFKINPGRNPLYTHLITYDLDGWEAAQFMRLLAPLGIADIEPRLEGVLQSAPPTLDPGPKNQELQTPNAERRTPNIESVTPNQEPRTPPPEPRTKNQEPRTILLHPGSTTRYKAWPKDRWVALIARLTAATGRPVVLVGGPADAPLARSIVAQCEASSREGRRPAVRGAQHARPPSEAMGEAAPVSMDVESDGTSSWEGRRPAVRGAQQARPPNSLSILAGKTTLEETADALSRAALFVGGDSGLAHLAVAMGTPTVVLFGPSDNRKWGARGPAHTVIRRELACAPCAMFGYHKLCRSIACMHSITVEEVATACLDQLH